MQQPDPTMTTDELQRALERFDWLADQMRDEVFGAEIADIRAVLADSTARTAAKERALVVLALSTRASAEAALRWFDAAGEHPRVRLLHRLARRECARRRAERALDTPGSTDTTDELRSTA